MIVRRRGDWVSAKIGDQVVMMNVETGQFVGLSKVGARIWELIEVPVSPDEICAQLVRQFEVTPERCRIEVDAFLDELEKYAAATVDSGSTP